MFIEVTKAEYIGHYSLRLWFNNQVVKDVDLSGSLEGEVFLPLRDIDFFKQFSVRFNTVEWKNGADFAPEYLYQIGKEVKPYADMPESSSNNVAEPTAGYNNPDL